MKSFFQRLHDSQPGPSKSISKDSHTLWTPPSRTEPERPRPSTSTGHHETQASAPQGRKSGQRSSSRAPQLHDTRIPLNGYVTDRYTSGSETDRPIRSTGRNPINLVPPVTRLAFSSSNSPDPPRAQQRTQDTQDTRISRNDHPYSNQNPSSAPPIVEGHLRKGRSRVKPAPDISPAQPPDNWHPPPSTYSSSKHRQTAADIQLSRERAGRYGDTPLDHASRKQPYLEEKNVGDRTGKEEVDRRGEERMKEVKERDSGRLNERDREKYTDKGGRNENDRDREREKRREREREREKERERGNEREREREREKEKEAGREREKEIERERERQKDRERERVRHDQELEKRRETDRLDVKEKGKDRDGKGGENREKDRNKTREQETGKPKESDREREKKKDRHKDRDREKERERWEREQERIRAREVLNTQEAEEESRRYIQRHRPQEDGKFLTGGARTENRPARKYEDRDGAAQDERQDRTTARERHFIPELESRKTVAEPSVNETERWRPSNDRRQDPDRGNEKDIRTHHEYSVPRNPSSKQLRDKVLDEGERKCVQPVDVPATMTQAPQDFFRSPNIPPLLISRVPTEPRVYPSSTTRDVLGSKDANALKPSHDKEGSQDTNQNRTIFAVLEDVKPKELRRTKKDSLGVRWPVIPSASQASSSAPFPSTTVPLDMPKNDISSQLPVKRDNGDAQENRGYSQLKTIDRLPLSHSRSNSQADVPDSRVRQLSQAKAFNVEDVPSTDGPVSNPTIASARVIRDVTNETEHDALRPSQSDVNNRSVQSRVPQGISPNPLPNLQHGSRPLLSARTSDRQGVEQRTSEIEPNVLASPYIRQFLVLPPTRPPFPSDTGPMSSFSNAQETLTTPFTYSRQDVLPLEKIFIGKETLHLPSARTLDERLTRTDAPHTSLKPELLTSDSLTIDRQVLGHEGRSISASAQTNHRMSIVRPSTAVGSVQERSLASLPNNDSSTLLTSMVESARPAPFQNNENARTGNMLPRPSTAVESRHGKGARFQPYVPNFLTPSSLGPTDQYVGGRPLFSNNTHNPSLEQETINYETKISVPNPIHKYSSISIVQDSQDSKPGKSDAVPTAVETLQTVRSAVLVDPDVPSSVTARKITRSETQHDVINEADSSPEAVIQTPLEALPRNHEVLPTINRQSLAEPQKKKALEYVEVPLTAGLHSLTQQGFTRSIDTKLSMQRILNDSILTGPIYESPVSATQPQYPAKNQSQTIGYTPSTQRVTNVPLPSDANAGLSSVHARHMAKPLVPSLGVAPSTQRMTSTPLPNENYGPPSIQPQYSTKSAAQPASGPLTQRLGNISLPVDKGPGLSAYPPKNVSQVNANGFVPSTQRMVTHPLPNVTHSTQSTQSHDPPKNVSQVNANDFVPLTQRMVTHPLPNVTHSTQSTQLHDPPKNVSQLNANSFVPSTQRMVTHPLPNVTHSTQSTQLHDPPKNMSQLNANSLVPSTQRIVPHPLPNVTQSTQSTQLHDPPKNVSQLNANSFVPSTQRMVPHPLPNVTHSTQSTQLHDPSRTTSQSTGQAPATRRMMTIPLPKEIHKENTLGYITPSTTREAEMKFPINHASTVPSSRTTITHPKLLEIFSTGQPNIPSTKPVDDVGVQPTSKVEAGQTKVSPHAKSRSSPPAIPAHRSSPHTERSPDTIQLEEPVSTTPRDSPSRRQAFDIISKDVQRSSPHSQLPISGISQQPPDPIMSPTNLPNISITHIPSQDSHIAPPFPSAHYSRPHYQYQSQATPNNTNSQTTPERLQGAHFPQQYETTNPLQKNITDLKPARAARVVESSQPVFNHPDDSRLPSGETNSSFPGRHRYSQSLPANLAHLRAQTTTLSSQSAVTQNITATSSREAEKPSHNYSDESILMTPSSLAPSILKPTSSHVSTTPFLSQQDSRKKRVFASFRSDALQAPSAQYAVWHPPSKTLDRSEPRPTADSRRIGEMPPEVKQTSKPKAYPPVTVFDPSENPNSKIFSPFRYLTSKRHRTMSSASLDAQDGTAANTVVGSPTASMLSQPPISLPPSRDPLAAAHAWRNREEEEIRARAKGRVRRQRPGVVFDVAENPLEDRKRPKLVRKSTKGRSSQPSAHDRSRSG